MKRAVLVFHILLAVVLIGGGISWLAFSQGSRFEASRIQASCDDKDAKETFINGHSYFCDDTAHFSAQMNAIAKLLHDRGA